MSDLFEPQAIIGRHTQEAPVNVHAIARDLGIDVHDDAPMSSDIAGKIVRGSLQSPSGYTIYINASDLPRRKRFTLAHEIAHFVLHRDLIGDGLIDDGLYRSKLGGTYERQANRFAANILMPVGLVRGYFRGATKSSAELGKIFDVSTDAMKIRLNEMKLAV